MRTTRVPLLLVAVTLVSAVLDTVWTHEYAGLWSDWAWAFHGWPLVTAATVGCSVMGALVLARYPNHTIGWLLCLSGVASVSLATEAYSFWVLDGDGPGSDLGGHLAAWVSMLLGAQVVIPAVTLIYLLAPWGRLPSPRWRWVVRATIAGAGLHVASMLTVDPRSAVLGDTGEEIGPVSQLLAILSLVTLAVCLVASAVSLVRRLLRARGTERVQVLWVASSAAMLAGGLVWLLVVQPIQGGQTLLSSAPLFVSFALFPVCIAVAVLRYRLFDIDLAVNRALVVTIATALVAVGYVLIVILLGPALGSGAGAFWGSLLATAVVAMAFQPVRRWVVRMADRLVYGPSASPYEALAEFSRRLGESPDPSRLLPAVAEAAGTAVGARRARADLFIPGSANEVGRWPVATDARAGADGATASVAVTDRGEVLGSVTVDMPAGRDLRARDSQLLRDLADQAAVAFRNARLATELARRVAELDRRTLDLAESRRRLVTAEDAERRRLERAIARDVVPHLEPLPARLDALARDVDHPPTPGAVRDLVDTSTAALEALREITRGVFPAQLTRSGLTAAVAALLARTGAGRLVVDGDRGPRVEPRVEAAAYFCVAEAVRELDPPLTVTLSHQDGELRLDVQGGERGGDVWLGHLRDRVEAVGGRLTQGGSTAGGVASRRVVVRLPARDPVTTGAGAP